LNIVFAGTPTFAMQHLSGLLKAGVTIKGVVTQPDKTGKRGKKLVPSPVKTLALEHGIAVIQPTRVGIIDLQAFKPDLLVVVAYGQILRQDLLDLPTHGCINVHGSLLPRWRGAAPIQRAIEAGDARTGICIMQMDAGLDTGPVLLEASTPIELDDTAASLSDRLSILGINGLLEVLNQVAKGQLQPKPQPKDGTYANKINKQEARIDWSDKATNICRKIQAFNPDPICFCECQYGDSRVRVKVYECETTGQKQTATPGSILDVSPLGISVATGQGVLLLKRVQLPLGKGSILTGRDIQNSRTDIFYVGASLL